VATARPDPTGVTSAPTPVTDMPAEQMSTAVVDLPFHHRIRIGISRGENWLQLIRFGVVGTSGFIVNTVAFAVCLHVVGLDYKIALPIAYLAGTTNNFIWNSRWTFNHKKEAHPAEQALKFFIVSAFAFGADYGIVIAFVHWTNMEKVLIQVIANILVIPINFLGQKLWSFRR
jgi:putative flippase GtrA